MVGLSLAYDIVKAHRGELKVISNEGPPGGDIKVEAAIPALAVKDEGLPASEEGAEFIVQLPLS